MLMTTCGFGSGAGAAAGAFFSDPPKIFKLMEGRGAALGAGFGAGACAKKSRPKVGRGAGTGDFFAGLALATGFFGAALADSLG